MTEYDFAFVEAEDDGYSKDEKLAIVGAPKSDVKSTAWGVTRYQPYYDLDDFSWAIAVSPRSYEQIEDALNTVIPPEYKPFESSGSGAVTLVRKPERNQFHLDQAESEQEAYKDAFDLLIRAFSYENPEAEFDPGAPRTKYVFRRSGSGPLMLIDRAVEILESDGFGVTVLGPEGGARGTAVDHALSWEFSHDLRDYQREAVDAAEEEEQGVIAIPTGGGKTVVAMRLIQRLSRRAVVWVHTKELLYQWAENIRDCLGVEPGMIGDDQWSEGPVTVAIMQSVVSRGLEGGEDKELAPEDYGVSIFDECHRTSAADTFHKVGQLFPSHYRIGLSATPWRRVQAEELWIEGAVGSEVYSVEPEHLIRKGYLAKPAFDSITHDGPTREGKHEHYQTAYKRCIAESEIRNSAIAEKAVDLAETGRRVIVNTRWISPANQIADIANEIAEARGSDAVAEAVSSESDNREERLQDFADGEIDIVASTLLKEGVDLPEVNAIILAHGGKSDVETVQTIGRALRPSGGDDAMIVDVEDNGMSFRDAYYQRQKCMNDYYGVFGPDGEGGEIDAEQTEITADGGRSAQESVDAAAECLQAFVDGDEVNPSDAEEIAQELRNIKL